MRTLLNLIWLVLAGFWLAVGYAIAGVICCVLIVTIPFGIASFRIAGFTLWPFGRTMVDKPSAGAGAVLGNIIWVVFAGWWLVLGHLATGIALCVTIIGIPLGLANFKLIPISLLPLGKEIVPTDQPFAVR
ncbi:YccF domain-containing protein [Kribbella capetownensis]|uniref:YccF domain-containing protein n=1 Tax=Kribbella capetownensis TaxID=1572659 RepID=A0A4R0JR86_9ACTN|nr:YccF domain-containing protein [Kribbella capetownensis]TCC47576.1 YccF domain-containing protein [Kribbella capetownensis]